jgi:F-type H+-transporting ATPase subunit b
LINSEKKASLTQIKAQVAELSLQITEKILKKTLADEKAQKELIKEYMKDIELN